MWHGTVGSEWHTSTRPRSRRTELTTDAFGARLRGLMVTVVLSVLNSNPTCLQSPWYDEWLVWWKLRPLGFSYLILNLRLSLMCRALGSEYSCTPATYKVCWNDTYLSDHYEVQFSCLLFDCSFQRVCSNYLHYILDMSDRFSWAFIDWYSFSLCFKQSFQ